MYRTRGTKLFSQVGGRFNSTGGMATTTKRGNLFEQLHLSERWVFHVERIINSFQAERERKLTHARVPARNADHIRDNESCETCPSDRQSLTLLTSAKVSFSYFETRFFCLIRRYLILVLFYSSFYILSRLSIFPFVFPFRDHARSTKISSWYARDIGHLFHRILNINEKFGIARQQHLIDLFTERITQRLARRVP